MAEPAFAQHIISSIRNELSLLKAHNYIQGQAYDDILRLLPRDINNHPMSSYNSPPSFPGGMIPTPSPTQSPMSTPSATGAPAPPPSYNVAANGLGSAEALYDYNGQNPSTDLSFHRGDIIQLTELVNDDWWKGSLNGKTGIFPRNYVKKIAAQEKNGSAPPPPARETQRDSYGYSPQPPKQDAYHYPPPPQEKSSYGPPPPIMPNSYAPPPPQSNSYAAPPPAQSNSYAPPPPQSNSYAPPPVQQVASTASASAAVEQPHEEGKVAGFGKKLAGNVANAATWGFGATIGSDIAHSIF